MWYGYNRGYDIGLDFSKIRHFKCFQAFRQFIGNIGDPRTKTDRRSVIGPESCPRSSWISGKTQMTPTGWLSKIIIYS